MSIKFYPAKHFFVCPECDIQRELSPKNFLSHIREKHGITEINGTRSLILHIDKKPRHLRVYELSIGGKKFMEYCI